MTTLSRLWILPGLGLFVALAALPSRAAPLPATATSADWPKTTPVDRKRSENNLKEIMLAMWNYHDSMGAFPPAAVTNKAGKPLLSWRVMILPYIEQNALYGEFKLDQAWDSPANKKLLAKMPKVYGLPGVRVKPEYGTFYRVFTGPDTPFRGNAGLRVVQITDGTANTLFVAEGGEAVPWTKPDELAVGARKPLPKLGGLFPEGFHTALADGTVKLLGRKVPERTLRALISPAGGEVVDWTKVPLAKAPAAKK